MRREITSDFSSIETFVSVRMNGGKGLKTRHYQGAQNGVTDINSAAFAAGENLALKAHDALWW